MRRLWFLAGFASIGAQSAERPTTAEPWDLSRASRFALERAPTVMSAHESVEIADKRTKNAFSLMLPQLDFASSHGFSNSVPIAAGSIVAASPGNVLSQMTLTLSETLYDNGVSWTQYRVSQAAQDLASLTARQAGESILLDLTKAFENFSFELRSYEVKEEQYKTLEKQYRSAESQYRQGLRLRPDVLRLKIQFERAHISLFAAKSGLQNSAREIVRAMGLDESVDLSELPARSPFLTMDLESLPAVPKTKLDAAEQSLDVQIARKQVEIEDGAVRIADRKRWPELQLTAGGDYAATGYLNTNVPFSQAGAWGWYALVGLNYNFWDWGIRRRSLEIERANERVLELTTRLKLEGARVNAADIMNDIAKFEALYLEAVELRAMEQSNYDTIGANYRDGRASYLELVESLNNLLDARLAFYSTVRDLRARIDDYHYLEGTLHESLGP